MESARKVLEETQYVTQYAEMDSKKCSGIQSRLETVVGFQCTNCSQGLVAETLSQKLCPIKLNGDTLECVDTFCYLGDVIGSGVGAEDASSMRVKCAWVKFRELSPILTARRASLKHIICLHCPRFATIYHYALITSPINFAIQLQRSPPCREDR